MNTWSVTEAKARLSEVVRRCQKERQTITRRGIVVAEMLSVAEFRRLGGKLDHAPDRDAKAGTGSSR
jgi:prevent-host-death family protein